MRCNLMAPEEYARQQQQKRRCIIIPVLMLLTAGSVLCGSLCLWLYMEAAAAKTAVTDMLYPLEQRLQEHNREETQLKQYYEHVKAAQEGRLHWTAILTALADTKPEGMSVQSVQGKGRNVTIVAQGTSFEDAKAWQQKLRRTENVETVQLKNMKQSSFLSKEMILEVTMGETHREQTRRN